MSATEGCSRALIRPAPHEASGNLIFTEAGLSPYYGLHAVTRGECEDYGEPIRGTFRRGGEQWVAELKPKSSGLAPRDDPSFDFETVKEFSLRVEAADADDQAAAPSVTYMIAPRWPDLESLGDSPNPNTPDIEGINVRFDGSNMPLEDYPTLLRRGMSAVDINPGYFAELHEYSNVWRYEEYTRVNRERAMSVVGDDGPLRRIFELLESEGSFRELREDDGETVGYHHRVKFDTSGAAALIGGHTLGKQIKHYHPKHVRGEGSDDPLAHPKIGVAFLSKRTDGGSVAWSDRADLERETRETLLNVLSWAGLPVRPDGETYVADDHFAATLEELDAEIREDPLPAIRREQGAAVTRVLAGEGVGNPNLNESDTETLQILADGGQPQDVGTLAEEIGRSRRTIYRVVERLSDVLEADNGVIGFASEYLASKARLGLSSALTALESAERDQAEESAWGRFMAEYAPQVGERFPNGEVDRIELDFGEVPRGADMGQILREGFIAWIRSGREADDYRHGRAWWSKDGTRDSTNSYGGMQFLPTPIELERADPLRDVLE